MNGFPAAVCAGLALWCSLGTIGLIGEPSTSARVALLASWWLLPLLIAAVFGVIRVLRLSPQEQSPLFGAAVVLLPWLPFPVPPAALLWTGPFMAAIWVAVVAGVILARARGGPDRWISNPRRAPIVAAALSLLLYGGSAVWLSPILPDGDEPHYLILAQSLIKDGDLRIENNHRRGDYLEYSLNAAAPDYLRRGTNGEIYSIHAPGLAVLIAPAMWLFGYPGVVAFLAVVAALSTALVWSVGYRVTESAASAWFGWGCCALTAPFFFQATEVFPDGVAATCLLIGIIPLIERDGLKARPLPDVDIKARALPDAAGVSNTWLWVLSGTSLAILPWLQTRLAVLAVAATICLAFRMRTARQLWAFATAPLVSGTVWFGFFMVIYGTPNPTAPYGLYTQTSAANLLRGFPGLLFDQQFGLIPNAPVYGFILAGVVAGLVTLRRWSWETLLLTGPYMAAVGTYQMWWGGTSVPARLLAPITLVLGVAAARLWQHIETRATKGLGILALIASVLITVALVGPDRGRLLLNFRDGISLWLEWANDALDLPRGLPSLFRDDRAQLWLKALIWTVTVLLLWIALRLIGRVETARPRKAPTSGLSWQSTWCAAAALMIAFTLAWHVDGMQPLTPETAEVGLLRHASSLQSIAYDFRASRFTTTTALLADLRIASDFQRRPVGPPALFTARDLPAGTYELRISSREPPAEGTLVVRVGATQLPFLTASSALVQSQPANAAIHLATRVRSLVVAGDVAAARSVSAVELVQVQRAHSADRTASDSALRAAHYESADAFFLDENAYPEPAGFWVAGGRTADVSIAADRFDLFVRNAPVENHVTIDVDGDVHELMLSAGEERLITLPTHRKPTARVRITSQSGFRPAATQPGSADLRYLGCWMEAR